MRFEPRTAKPSHCTRCLCENCFSDWLRLTSQWKEHYTRIRSFEPFFHVHSLYTMESKPKPISEAEGKVVFLSFIITDKEKK